MSSKYVRSVPQDVEGYFRYNLDHLKAIREEYRDKLDYVRNVLLENTGQVESLVSEHIFTDKETGQQITISEALYLILEANSELTKYSVTKKQPTSEDILLDEKC